MWTISDDNFRIMLVGVVIGLIILLALSGKRIFKKTVNWIKDHFTPVYPIRREAQQDREIYIELVELRALIDSDRAYVFRFHNGTEFLPSHPAWKISCTHEVVKPGVAYESIRLQNILVSLIPNLVGPVLTGSSSAAGIYIPECPECLFKKKCLKENKRIIVIQVADMEGSFCKFHLESQNIKTAVLCGIAKNGNVCGLIGVDFCGARLDDEHILPVAQRLCRSTEKIQYHLQYKKAPFDDSDRQVLPPLIR